MRLLIVLCLFLVSFLFKKRKKMRLLILEVGKKFTLWIEKYNGSNAMRMDLMPSIFIAIGACSMCHILLGD